MPFSRPGLNAIITRIANDIESRTGVQVNPEAGNVPRVFAESLGGASHMLHAHIDWGVKQILPTTATDDALDQHALLWLTTPRKPATFASGNVVLTGMDGTLIPIGTTLRNEAGYMFATNAEATIIAGKATVHVVAQTMGTASNTAADAAMSLVSPILNVNNTGTVAASGIAGGADIENDAALRARILTRIKMPPHGGSANDYEQWALSVAGITRVWVKPNAMGLNTVTVVFVRDNDANIIPDAEACVQLQTYLDKVRPVTVTVYAVAPQPLPVNYMIKLSPDTTTNRAAVIESLKAFHRRDATLGGTLYLSRIREAISLSAGEFNHELLSPTADVVADKLALPIFGSVTWRN